MKTIIALLMSLFFSINLYSQTHILSGQVADSLTKENLISANVILKNFSNSDEYGTTTDKNGVFRFEGIKRGKYNLKISYVGYKTFQTKIEIKNKSIDLEKILLPPIDIETNEVEVVGKVPPVIQNADTTQFNSDAFKTNKDATAQDLVQKMPGMTVSNGKVQSQGEDVKKVLVDGKPFFGDDPSAVLKNVPAEIIEKIQVFDQQSDQAQFTGFDDGNSSKTINLITRMKFRQGTFGKLAAGYGNEEKYLSSGNINIFNGDQRITFLGQINNINEQNFSNEDLLGVMSQGGGGRRGGFSRPPGGNSGGGSGSSRGGNFRGGGSASDFLVNAQNGLTNTKSFGFNYSDKWSEKLDVSGSYFFNTTNNDAESITNRDYFLNSSVQQNYAENNSSISKNINHRFSLRMNYQIDSSNSIILEPRLTAQINDGSSNIVGNTNSGLTNLNSTSSLFNSNLSAINFSNQLLYRHKFLTKGRTFSINLNTAVNNNKGDNNLYSENTYFTNLALSDTLDQISNLNKKGTSISPRIIYTEPLSDNSILQLGSSFTYSKDESDQKTFNGSVIGNYNLLDTSLSNNYNKVYNTQSYSTGYRYRKDNIMLMANLNYNISQLKSEQVYPYAATTEKTFNSVLPSFMFRYNISRDKNFRFFYRTNNNDPSVEQLQNVLDNSNPLQLSIGNPNLKQDYTHSFFMHYSQINMRNLNSFFVLLGGTFTQNYIGYNTIIAQSDTTVLNNITLAQGSELKTPINVNGYVNLRSFFTYGSPIYFLKSNLNLNLSANFSRTPGVINGFTNFANSTTLGAGFVLSSNFSENLDFTLSSNSSYNIVKNSVNELNNNNYLSETAFVKFYWLLWEDFTLQSDFNYQYNGGYSNSYDPNSYLLNASIGKKLFADNRGEIRFTAYDILNKNNNVQRTVSDSYIEETQSNVLGRYFMLSFIYNIKNFY